MMPHPQGGEVFLQVFEKLYGVPCCGSKREDRGSLTLDFGTPHFAMRQMTLPQKCSEKAMFDLVKGAIYVRGDWRLIIHSGPWKILSKNGRVLLRWSSALNRYPARYLSGESLVDFSMDSKKMESVFEFHSGKVLISQASPHVGRQWSLHEPWGATLALRKGKSYSYYSDDRATRLRTWKPVPQ